MKLRIVNCEICYCDSIGHSRDINTHDMASRLSGQDCRFFKLFCVSIPRKGLNRKKTAPNIAVCPESLPSRVRILTYQTWSIGGLHRK